MAKVSLRTEQSCEIEDLIDAVREKTNKGFEEVEKAMFKTYLYPEGSKTFVTADYKKADQPEYKWLYDAIYDIMDDNNIQSMYITEAI